MHDQLLRPVGIKTCYAGRDRTGRRRLTVDLRTFKIDLRPMSSGRGSGRLCMTDDTLAATITIAAPAEAVFAVLTDPASHPAIDGTGWVSKALDTAPLTGSGQTFRMGMYHANHPDGTYEVANRVAMFEPPRAVSWEPGQDVAGGEEPTGRRLDLALRPGPAATRRTRRSRSPTTGRPCRRPCASTSRSRRSPWTTSPTRSATWLSSPRRNSQRVRSVLPAGIRPRCRPNARQALGVVREFSEPRSGRRRRWASSAVF